MIGIICVGMGIGSSYGLCSLCGLMYTNMHSILPFMLLGIGIDDMFVIVQSFDNLDEKEKQESLFKRFGLTMRHAGVAITITSVTDLLAFGIGASTVLPALSSFCVYAALGIVFVFFYMATFFLAWFSIDQRRSEAHRDGCICCLKYKNWVPNSCSQKSLLETVFGYFGKGLTMLPVKIAVLVVTLGVTSASIWGVTQIDVEFKVAAYNFTPTFHLTWHLLFLTD